MPSLGENRGPYSFDYSIVRHKEKNILTILNNPGFDSLLENIEDAYEYTKGYVPAGYEHRQDLISNLFLGSPDYWWMLMLVNTITDPIEGFYLNQQILIPEL